MTSGVCLVVRTQQSLFPLASRAKRQRRRATVRHICLLAFVPCVNSRFMSLFFFADALAAGEAEGAGKADASASGVKRKRPSDAAAASVDATVRASPSRKGSASREALPAAAKPASAGRAAQDDVVTICDFCCLLPGAEHLGHACVPLVTHERQLRTGSGVEGAAAGAGVGFAAVAEASLSPLPLHFVPAGENEAAAALSRAGSMQGAETRVVQQASPPSTGETRWCAL